MRLPRHAELWFPGYVRSRLKNWRPPASGRVWLTIADHWEPYWNKASLETAMQRATLWAREWPVIAARHSDSDGCPPRYTFFYPQEEYNAHILERLAEMAARKIADVEIHIHHGGEGERAFLDRMSGFIETLSSRHGLLRKQNGKTLFGFIHGNWALDNARPDRKACGLNNEITLLRDLGCYADFTMPSGNHPTQARMVNTIYWAVDDPLHPRSFDTGLPVAPGVPATGDLLMIPGPLGLRWTERLLPRLENGEIAQYDPPTPYRAERWLDLAPRIGSDIFIKLHTHGAQERNSDVLLNGGGLDRLFNLLSAACRRRGHKLRYVSAWEMRQAVDAACGAVTPPTPNSPAPS